MGSDTQDSKHCATRRCLCWNRA